MAGALVFFLIPAAHASVGIGLKWDVESTIIKEESTSCVIYRLYNPFDSNVTGYLQALGEIKDLALPIEAQLVPAGTSSVDALEADICFSIPNVYKEDCILGPLLCERKCDEPPVQYNGEVQGAYNLGGIGGTGSATGSSVSAPLRITAGCEQLTRDWTPVYAAIAIVVIAIIGVFVRRRRQAF